MIGQIALGIAIGIAANWLYHKLLNQGADPRMRARVFDIETPDNRDQFYVELKRSIANATSSVVQFAEGFATEPNDRLVQARKYIDDIKTILASNRDLKWMRIQTRAPCSRQWFDLLKEVHTEFPSQFAVYIIKNRPNQHALSVAALIDPGTKKGKTFLLASSGDNLGGNETVNTANVGLMIAGNTIWTKALKQSLVEMSNPELSTVITLTANTTYDELPQR